MKVFIYLSVIVFLLVVLSIMLYESISHGMNYKKKSTQKSGNFSSFHDQSNIEAQVLFTQEEEKIIRNLEDIGSDTSFDYFMKFSTADVLPPNIQTCL